MKYDQDRNASGEILRLLIQKMSEHPASFTPLSYTVWYEHVTGINSALSEEIDKLLTNNEKLDDATIDRLHSKYISEFDVNVERALRQHVLLLLDKISQFTTTTDSQAQQFGNNLQSYSNTLKQKLDPPKLVALVNSMVGDTNHMLGVIHNMHTELAACKQKSEGLRQELHTARGEAMTDPLTGILNRRGFESGASQILLEHTEQNKNLCLLMIDIDHFKKINDSYGHLFGDKVICAIAETLKSKVRGQDIVARMGGEEFSVLLADTDSRGASIVAEHIRKTIEACKIFPRGAKESIGGITVSIGVAKYNNADSLLDLLDHADKALFTSKKQGRNRTTEHPHK